MAYSQWTTGSRSAIKRFAHNARIDRAIDLLALEPGDRILDYGMGDGMLLRRIHQRQPGARLCGFEPRISQEAEAGTADIALLTLPWPGSVGELASLVGVESRRRRL